jgi:hypothetical protein
MTIPSAIGAVLAGGSGQSITIDWGAFALVFAVALVAGVVIVSFYALGLRLLSLGSPADGSDVRGEVTAVPDATTRPRPALAVPAAMVCFAIGAAAVLYGLYLIIPQFH